MSAYVDGELAGASRDAVEAHLATCRDCSRAAEEFRRLDDLAHRDRVPPVRGEEWAGVLRSVLSEATRPEAARWAEEDPEPFQVIVETRPGPGGTPSSRAPLESAGDGPAGRRARRGYLSLAAAAALVIGAAMLTIVLSPGDRQPERGMTTSVPQGSASPGSPDGPPQGDGISRGSQDSEDYATRSESPQPEIEEKPKAPRPQPPLEDL